jgi:hypothetical protein
LEQQLVADRLGRAVQGLYDAFATYGFPEQLEASPVHEGKDFVRELSAVPLRRLSQDQLDPYAASAMTTVGGVDDYRHFLPRILELALARGGWPGLDPDLVASKLTYENWRTWPALEQRAIEKFYFEAWRRFMRLDPEDYDAVPWFTGIALLGLDVAAACTELRAANSANASLHLSSFISTQSKALWRGSSLWEECPRETREVLKAWLLGEEPLSILIEQISFVHPNDQWEVEAALDRLDELKASGG